MTTQDKNLGQSYDALLLVSFGGPEGMHEVMPFLENVLRGRNVPRERMLKVAEHYNLFGGVSPINEQNRKLVSTLQKELDANGPPLPIYWGNRNWHPLLPDTIQQMADDGIKNALAFVTSAYSSYSSCRQYRQNIADAQAVVGRNAPRIDKLRAFYNHPLFIEANVDQIKAGLQKLDRGSMTVVFTAHSIPESMANNCDYAAQLTETGKLVAEFLGIKNWQLVFQSRSGAPSQRWLGPDICDQLRALRKEGVTKVLVAPIGFVSDHMEVIYDLDHEAQHVADEVGIKMVRAATAGTHPAFVKMIRELILERVAGSTPRALGDRGIAHDVCPVDCCLSV